MKEIRKKSGDGAVNQLIVKAYRSQTELAWDRADAMQPQCGFGRLGICCTDCYEGPCRVNPFAESEQFSICGRSRQDLTASFFLKNAAGGAAALVNLATDFGADFDKAVLQAVSYGGDVMVIPADCSSRYAQIGQTVVQALSAVSGIKERSRSAVTAVNLGVLTAGSVNILLHGHVSPKVTALLEAAAARQNYPVNFVGLCGGEASGKNPLPPVTNYDSQETVLLTEAVDLLIVGTQCVMPAMLSLAGRLGVPVISAADVADSTAADQGLLKAVAAFSRRAGKKPEIPEVTEKMTVGCYASCEAILASLKRGYTKGTVKGIVYLGGCGNITNTQDAALVKQAQQLSNEGYYIVTAGCAGIALAKAGMCQPGYSATWQTILPVDAAPVLYVGACHDAGEFLLISQAAKEQGLPVFAVLPEITHSKMLATAIGFLTQGITTYAGIGEAASFPEITLKGRLLPLSELRQLPQALAEIAAGVK